MCRAESCLEVKGILLVNRKVEEEVSATVTLTGKWSLSCKSCRVVEEVSNRRSRELMDRSIEELVWLEEEINVGCPSFIITML